MENEFITVFSFSYLCFHETEDPLSSRLNPLLREDPDDVLEEGEGVEGQDKAEAEAHLEVKELSLIGCAHWRLYSKMLHPKEKKSV